jgi:hypothetical protein
MDVDDDMTPQASQSSGSPAPLSTRTNLSSAEGLPLRSDQRMLKAKRKAVSITPPSSKKNRINISEGVNLYS